jgi:uncharacterized iron-regulated protein
MRITALFIILAAAALFPALCAAAGGLRSPYAYIAEKVNAHDVILLGTTHQQPAILNFIADLLPQLTVLGVTHVALEIASDQQHRIDTYLSEGIGLSDIALLPAIDCSGYRHLLEVLRDIPPDRRPAVKAIDLPLSRYSSAISRDEFMAAELTVLFRLNARSKVLVILGGLHVLRLLDWQPKVLNRHLALRTYLKRDTPSLRVCSILNIVSGDEKTCDFSRAFGSQPGAVALDLDERFSHWRMGLTEHLAIRKAQPNLLVDGVIVY